MLPAERGLVSAGACACTLVCVYACVLCAWSVRVVSHVRVLFVVCTRVWEHTCLSGVCAWCVETDTGEWGMREEGTQTFLSLLTRDPSWPPEAAPLPVPCPQPRGPAPDPEALPAPGAGLC